MINASPHDLEFEIQEGVPAQWCRRVDTARSSPDDFLDSERDERLANKGYRVGARSVVVLTQD